MGTILKWLTIGFLGTLALLCLTVVLVVWRFTPLIEVDDKNDHVKLLGGLIDVNGKSGSVHLGNMQVTGDDRPGSKVSGSQTIDRKRIQKIHIPFANGDIELKTSTDAAVHWNCKFDGPHGSGQLMERPGMMAFDFGQHANLKCEIEIPKKLKAELEGANGKVELAQPQGDIDVKLTNGKVSMEPAEGVAYKYDLRVQRGMIADFKSSDDPKAIKIKMDITNGAISNEE